MSTALMNSTHMNRTLQAWRLRLPLERPYRLAFGPVEALDTVVVRMAVADPPAGEAVEGYGEATLLTGYTDETIDGAWSSACAAWRSSNNAPSCSATACASRASWSPGCLPRAR